MAILRHLVPSITPGRYAMRFVVPIVGLVSLAIGCILALLAVVGHLRGDTEPATALGIMGAILALVGARWIRDPDRWMPWRDAPPTRKQMNYADDLGIRYPSNITRGELSDLISERTDR